MRSSSMNTNRSDTLISGFHQYHIYGLNYLSEIEIPQLDQQEFSGSPDVIISRKSVDWDKFDAVDHGLFWKSARGKFQLMIDTVGTFEVLDGNQIRVDIKPDTAPKDVGTYLLGSVSAALLYQRGALLLHASAIQFQGEAVLFAGNSGGGKSTVATALMQRGFAVLSDDIAHIECSGHELLMHPSLPRTKLMPEAAGLLNVDTSTMLRDHAKGKYLVPVSNFAEKPLPVKQVVFLTWSGEGKLEFLPVTGSDIISHLSKVNFRRNFLKGMGLLQQNFERMNRLAAQATFHKLSRTLDIDKVLESVDSIEAMFSSEN